MVGHEVPAGTPVTPVVFYTRLVQCHSAGPKVTQAQLRRLNSVPDGRLIVWDIGGVDTRGQPLLAVVPSGDIRPTPAQLDSTQRHRVVGTATENLKH